MLLAALLGPRIAARRSPKRVAQAGLIFLALAAVLLIDTVDVELDSASFAFALVIFGIGAGLLASQLGNVILSSVDQSRSSEAGGLQGTAQNLGASLGTALIGAILLTGLTTGFVERVEENPDLPPEVSQAVTTTVDEQGIQIIPVDDAEALLVEAGLPPSSREVAEDTATRSSTAWRTRWARISSPSGSGSASCQGTPMNHPRGQQHSRPSPDPRP
jgi:hypothetical protein